MTHRPQRGTHHPPGSILDENPGSVRSGNQHSAARMRPRARTTRPPRGCRRTRGSIAVVPSFSIHLSLCSTGFRRLPGSYEEIRLLRGHRPVVVASFGSTAHADPRRPPWVRTLDVPPLPPLLPSRPRLDFGRRVRRHADPAGSACSGVYFRSVLRFASGFFPTRPRGARVIGVSRRQTLRAVASGSRLLPTRPAKDFHLQSSAHARHTSAQPMTSSRRGDCSATPLTEPDMRARIRLFGSICQNSSDSWADTRDRLRSFHKALSEAIRPSNQDGG